VRLFGASPELIFVLAIAAMLLAVTGVRLTRYLLNRGLFGGAGRGK
jgi:hypothetical protein